MDSVTKSDGVHFLCLNSRKEKSHDKEESNKDNVTDSYSDHVD